jgi:hypothetical protein
MKKTPYLFFVLLNSLFLFSSCNYTEKQSENASQTVYATNEALAKERIDLAYFYSNETTKFIQPPKHPIKISAIYDAGTVVNKSKNAEKTRVIIVPPQYKNDKVVVIDSVEYQQLLKDSSDKAQFVKDNKTMSEQLLSDNKELVHQKAMKDKMVVDLNHLQQQIYKKDLELMWRNIIIIGLLGLIGVYFYAKANGLFFL